MATYKRINQLNQTYSANDNDFLPIDSQGISETQKIKKSDLFYSYIKDAPNDEVTKNWSWVRRNGNWYRIYPDDYIFEAPMDGKIYVRLNGEWSEVSGVSGDMLRSVYDKKGKALDIYEYVDKSVGVPDNATESLLGAPMVKVGEKIEKDFSIESNLNSFLINGETIEILDNPIVPKSFENKSYLEGTNNFSLFISGKDLLKSQEMEIGSYSNRELKNIIRTSKPAKVNSGEKYKINSSLEGISYKFISVNEFNELDDVFSTSFLSLNSEIEIPKNVEYIGIECKYSLGDFEKPYNSYIEKTIISYNNQFQKIEINSNSPLYSIKGISGDYIDVISQKEVHNIQKESLTYDMDWNVSSIGEGYRSSTVPFELEKPIDKWINNFLIYGNSNSLEVKSLNDFIATDSECLAFANGKIYLRISYSHLQKSIGQTEEDYKNGLQSFLYENPIEVIYLSNRTENDISLPTIKTYDSITNFVAFYSNTIDGENYSGRAIIEAKFNSVVNSLVRKNGDSINGQLVFFGEDNLVTKSITGSDGNGAIGGALYLNKNTQDKVFVNGNNPVLDLRDFSDNLEWSPKAKTIEKGASDNRIVNAEHLSSNYAPIDSPNLTGVPTAPKATSKNTNQIATGEFVEENYYSKDIADTNFIKATDGVAKGNLTLDETIPEDYSSEKLVPNIEFLNNYYYNKNNTNEKFAPLNSPNFTGIPTVPSPDEVTGSQITNVDYVKSNFVNKNGDSIYGNLTIEGAETEKGNLTVKGNINNAKYNSSGEIENNNFAIVTDENGNLITSEVKTSELQSLKGIKGNIQSQIDNIPKYNYLSGISLELTLNDWPSQSELDIVAIETISSVYSAPSLWDAVTISITLLPSDKKRDLLYYYNDGSSGSVANWYYLYDLSTSINRANGTVAGIVENSINGDVTFEDGSPIVNHSTKADILSTSRKINGTDFNGNSDIITSKWGASRQIKLEGNVSGSVTTDGSSDIVINSSFTINKFNGNEDLNSYNTISSIGSYTAESDTISQSILNTPTSLAFGLSVESIGSGVLQTVIEYSISNPKRYFRTFDQETSIWSQWYRIYSEADKIETGDINALPLSGGIVTGTLALSKTQIASATEDNSPALIVGGTNTTSHIEIDSNKVIAKQNEVTGTSLYLNPNSGSVIIGSGGLEIEGDSTFIGKIIIPTPTSDTEAATKKYVDEKAAQSSGDMLKSVYDIDNNGIVDNASALNGKSDSDFATAVQGEKADNAMPKSGGAFTGAVSAPSISTSVANGSVWLNAGTNSEGAEVKYRFHANDGVMWIHVYVGGSIVSTIPLTIVADGISTLTGHATQDMPLTGGTFKGNVIAYGTNRSSNCLRNGVVQNSSGTAQSTNYLIFRRK